MNLVVVESPAKAKTIEKYLGKDYKVLASFGHVRDLPSKTGSVRPEEDFAMDWAIDSRAKTRIKDIETALEKSDKLILATDPDREGEAISWHLLEVLAKKKALKDKKIERVVFNAITKKSIIEAINNPRELDMQLVDAYLARRALDYLVGFTLSPVLWRKLPGSRSAGRVQSVALRLITERETEIEKFISEEYWTVETEINTAKGKNFAAKLVKLNGEKLDKFTLNNEKKAKEAVDLVKSASLLVKSVKSKPLTKNPPAPFTTSTLQQDASRRLGFSATRTMQTAQKLYEGVDIGGDTVGLITYMRTDSVSMIGEAINEARSAIKNQFGAEYVPDSARKFKSKAKNAQEAHEAIRPTSFTRTPDSLNLSGDMAKLYRLIWNRAMASQMQSAKMERTTIEIGDKSDNIGIRATGTIIRFDGFTRLYEEAGKKQEEQARLPEVKEGDMVVAEKITPEQHFTQPPPRYSEASLVKKMEELGIGRPSTYASILKVLQDRGYVTLDKKRFIPDDKGRLVIAFLEEFFTKYVQYGYTADLEERLDEISAGRLDWKTLLSEFWEGFSAHVDGTKDLRVTQVLDALNIALGPMVFPEKEDGSDPRACPSCDDGKLSLKVSRFGSFVGCSNYPECKFTRPFGKNGKQDNEQDTDRILGTDPDSGLDVWLKNGRYGPYVQLGEEKKPKRVSLPKDWPYDSMDLFKALKLLSLPREIGKHPEDDKIITASIGRFGPYILHNGVYANLQSVDEMFEVGINRAVALLAEKKAKRGGAGALKELGNHPETKKPVRVMSGRYGPYIKYEKTNATIPKDIDPQDVTMEMALELIAAKQAKSKQKTAGKKKQTKKKAPAKKK